jgi:hypothetical protein
MDIVERSRDRIARNFRFRDIACLRDTMICRRAMTRKGKLVVLFSSWGSTTVCGGKVGVSLVRSLCIWYRFRRMFLFVLP